MNIDVSVDELASFIAGALRVDLEVGESGDFLFKINNSRISAEFTESREKLSRVIDELESFDEIDETVLSTNNYFEVVVREEGSFPTFFLGRREGPIENIDVENGYSYRVGPPSYKYLAFLLCKIAKISDVKYFLGGLHYTQWERVLAKNSTAMEILSSITSRLMTLTVESTRQRAPKEMQSMASAYLFQFSYNLDIALVQQRFLEEMVRGSRVIRQRRSGFDEFDAPKRKYISDIVHHYQLGVGADNPVLEFISFYHVLEHFFESALNDDLVERVRDKITRPDFSYKRKKDIIDLVKDIGKTLQVRSETITFNEASALSITLSRHVSLADLKDRLEGFDSELIGYYRENKVSFSDGPAVDFSSMNKAEVFKNLSSRIYKTRNSIVHSKDGDKSKFMPFHHERELLKEIPLIRILAEDVIVRTSELIK